MLARHSQGRFFHGSAWARVLRETYGHRPVYFCRIRGEELLELLPLMEVISPLTGRRGVSLPFTDFCPPIKTDPHEYGRLHQAAMDYGLEKRWRYFEYRSNDPHDPVATPSLAFYSHTIGLEPSPDLPFHDSIIRGVKKAEKANVQIAFHDSFEAIQQFYVLHCATRKRHGLPPQPFRFFENIFQHVIKVGQGFVTTARLGIETVAAAVFFHNQREALYKFGASNFAFQHLRPNNLLMWKSIRRCAEMGLGTLHLGRTSLANEGLRRFKLGFGAREERIEYFKYDFARQAFVTDTDKAETWATRFFRRMPVPLLRFGGRMLYPHLS